MGQTAQAGNEVAKTLWSTAANTNPSWPPNTDHEAIRSRAMGVLNLMKSFPHTPPTWTGTMVPATQPPTKIDIRAAESICTKCKQQDIGLLFCDRCPEAVTLYHPTCLIRIEGTSDRVCDHCWEENQTLTGTPSVLREATKDNELTGQPQGNDPILLHSRESMCAKCKKQDIGLLLCDRCPEEVETLYHPACLTRIEGTADRVCKHCWEAHESTGSQATTQETTRGKTTPTLAITGDDTTQPIPSELPNTTENSEDHDSSETSSNESDYNPKFRPSPRVRQRRQLPREKPTPKITSTQVARKTKTSPLQTRAARRAVTKAREDAFDTSEEGETE
jgi:hypothetical protein